MKEPLSDGQRGRRIGRALLAVALLAIAVDWFLFIAAPGFMEPMFIPRFHRWLGRGILLLGVVGQVGGCVWMLRIHRANPEPDQHAWRYQRFPGPAPRR
jgi:hypothetical protein